MTVNHPWGYNSYSSVSGFSIQMNDVANGCTVFPPNPCSGPFWLQTVAFVGGNIVGSYELELWYYTNNEYYYDYCGYSPQNLPDINQTGYSVVLQTTIVSTTSVTCEYTLINNGNNVYQYSKTVTDPGGYWVNVFNDEEGAMVGVGNYGHAGFTPYNTELFHGYIDLVSNYNDLYSSSAATQTGETSNLLQIVTSKFGEPYGSMYLYTVQFTENTKYAP